MEDTAKIAEKIGEIITRRAGAMTVEELREYVKNLPLSVNERREAFGYEKVQADGADEVFVPHGGDGPIYYTDSEGTRAEGARIFGQSFMNALEIGNADRRLGSRIDRLSDVVIVIAVVALSAFVMGVVTLCN